MADRYRERDFPAEHDSGHQAGAARPRGDSDPLAELARLIGQTDPYSKYARGEAAPAAPAYDPAGADDHGAAAQPSWMKNVAARRRPVAAPPVEDDYDPAELEQAAAHDAPAHDPGYDDQPDFRQPPSFVRAARAQQYQPPEPPQYDEARYDDALYGSATDHDNAYDYDYDQQGYPEQAMAYADDAEESREPAGRRRRGGLMTVGAIIALGVLGTGAAFGYRTYLGPAHHGAPPVIKADTSPTKIVPPSAEASAKPIQDRLAASSGTEKIVPREEQPVDVNTASVPDATSPRIVFPPLNQVASVPPVVNPSPPPLVRPSGSGILAGDQPRKIQTLTVRPDQPEPVPAPPPTRPVTPQRAAATRTLAPAANPRVENANAAAPNAPLSLSPQAAPEPRPMRVATTTVPAAAPAPVAGGYLVQVSSQRNEADAQASYRVLQSKFPSVLGSRSPVIRRADLGEKGVYYRAMVGPFASSEEASHFCGNLKSAGGQCVIQRN